MRNMRAKQLMAITIYNAEQRLGAFAKRVRVCVLGLRKGKGLDSVSFGIAGE